MSHWSIYKCMNIKMYNTVNEVEFDGFFFRNRKLLLRTKTHRNKMQILVPGSTGTLMTIKVPQGAVGEGMEGAVLTVLTVVLTDLFSNTLKNNMYNILRG